MKKKLRKFEMVEERNELGSLFIERLIERLLLEELGLSIPHQMTVLYQKYGRGYTHVENNQEKLD